MQNGYLDNQPDNPYPKECDNGSMPQTLIFCYKPQPHRMATWTTSPTTHTLRSATTAGWGVAPMTTACMATTDAAQIAASRWVADTSSCLVAE